MKILWSELSMKTYVKISLHATRWAASGGYLGHKRGPELALKAASPTTVLSPGPVPKTKRGLGSTHSDKGRRRCLSIGCL